ncbi:MAG: hypothetical protein HYY03_03490 [Chloroflexi bacterium]|nr:hypothetical protein [Chloroflexota bacterium]
MSALRTGLAIAIVLGLLSVLAAWSGAAPGQGPVGARAQTYPPPVGSLSTQSSSTTPLVGATTTLSATVLDSAGTPVVGSSVVFIIDSQPGSDATFSNGLNQITASTDATGTATAVLSVGRSPGSIIVKTISGDKTSLLTLQVQSAVGVPPTGGRPSSEGGGLGLAAWQAALLAASIAVFLSGSVFAVRRWRRS